MKNFWFGFILMWAIMFTIGAWGIYDENKSLKAKLEKVKEEPQPLLGLTKKERETIIKAASTLSEAHGRTRIGFN